MYIFLPDARDGLPALVERVCSEPGFLDTHVPPKCVPVGNLLIPRFKISSGFEASEILKKLGLVFLFHFCSSVKLITRVKKITDSRSRRESAQSFFC